MINLLKESLKKYIPEAESIEPKFGPERSGDIKHSLASIEKAKVSLGYNPEIDLATGLDTTIDWYIKT